MPDIVIVCLVFALKFYTLRISRDFAKDFIYLHVKISNFCFAKFPFGYDSALKLNETKIQKYSRNHTLEV